MRNVLLVEDNPYDAELIRVYLESSGIEQRLQISHNIEDGLSLMKNVDFHIILTDLNLPDSDGISSVQRLVEVMPSAPIVVLTGSDDESLALQAVREGAQDYLIKSKINAEALERVMAYATERYQQSKEWKYLAFHDALTSIGNRTMMMHDLEANIEQIKRYGGQFAFHIIDLNDFKLINDIHGHDAGDALLKMVAQRLTACIRGVDGVMRFGGDEFVIIQYDVKTLEDVGVMTKKIKNTFKKKFDYKGMVLPCSASIGSAVYPTHAKNSAALLKEADIALYKNKEQGKNEKKP